MSYFIVSVIAGLKCVPLGLKLKALIKVYPLGTAGVSVDSFTQILVTGCPAASVTLVPSGMLMVTVPLDELASTSDSSVPPLVIGPLPLLAASQKSTVRFKVATGTAVGVAVCLGVAVAVAVAFPPPPVAVAVAVGVAVAVAVDVDVGLGVGVGVGGMGKVAWRSSRVIASLVNR